MFIDFCLNIKEIRADSVGYVGCGPLSSIVVLQTVPVVPGCPCARGMPVGCPWVPVMPVARVGTNLDPSDISTCFCPVFISTVWMTPCDFQHLTAQFAAAGVRKRAVQSLQGSF